MKRERELEETFANRELSKAGELAPHITGMRSGSERAREAFRGEKVQKRGEGEAFAFRELRVCAPRCEKRGEGETEAPQKGGELARSARSARANCRRSEEERRRSHGRGGERRRRKGRGLTSKERPAKLSHELLELLERSLELSSQGLSPIGDCAELCSALAQLSRSYT